MLETIFSVNTLWYLMLLIYIPACAGLIIIVLLQKGKGVGFSGAFGMGGGGDAIFGPRSSRSLPQQMTYAMAGIFMFLALCMSVISGTVNRGASPELTADPGAEVAISSDELDTLLDPNAPVPAEGSSATPADAAATSPGAITIPMDSSATPAEAPADAPVDAPVPVPEDGGVGVLSPNAVVEAPSAPVSAPAAPAPAAPAPAAPAPAAPAPAASTGTPQ